MTLCRALSFVSVFVAVTVQQAAAQFGGMPGMPGGLDLPSGLDLSGLGIGGPAQPGPRNPKGPDENEDEP